MFTAFTLLGTAFAGATVVAIALGRAAQRGDAMREEIYALSLQQHLLVNHPQATHMAHLEKQEIIERDSTLLEA